MGITEKTRGVDSVVSPSQGFPQFSCIKKIVD